MKKPFILFFIAAMAPTDQDRLEANKLSEMGVQLGFRNASLTSTAKLKEDANECNGVAGSYTYNTTDPETGETVEVEVNNIPANYAEHYPDAYTVAKKFQVENETAATIANGAANGVSTDNPPKGSTENDDEFSLINYGYGDGEYVYCEAQAACDNHSQIWPATGQPLGPNNERSYAFTGKGERKSIHPEDAVREFEAGNVTILDKSEVVTDMNRHLASAEGQEWLSTPDGQAWAASAEGQTYEFSNPGPATPVVNPNPAPAGFTTG